MAAYPVAHLVARLSGLQEMQPLRFRRLVFGSDDFDLVAGMQDGGERHQFHIHLGGNGVVAYFGVYEICEVQRSRTLLYASLLAFARKDEYVGADQVAVYDIQ